MIPTPPVVNDLEELAIEEVSAVDAPANEHCVMVLAKSATPPEPVTEPDPNKVAAAVLRDLRAESEPPVPRMTPEERGYAITKLREQLEQEKFTLDALDDFANKLAGGCVAIGAGVTLTNPRLTSYMQDGKSIALEVANGDGRTFTVSWPVAKLSKEWLRTLAHIPAAIDVMAPLAKRLSAIGARP